MEIVDWFCIVDPFEEISTLPINVSVEVAKLSWQQVYIIF